MRFSDEYAYIGIKDGKNEWHATRELFLPLIEAFKNQFDINIHSDICPNGHPGKVDELTIWPNDDSVYLFPDDHRK